MDTSHIDLNKYFNKKSDFKNRRDELVSRLCDGINRERIGTEYKPATKAHLAKIINRNPFLARSDGELELLIKECERKGNYKKFWWVVNPKKDVDNSI